MATIQNTNHPGEFRRTLPSGAEIWGSARLTRHQNTMLSSASRPLQRQPNGTYGRVYDNEILMDELLIWFMESPEAGWTVKDKHGDILDQTREAIENIDIRDEDNAPLLIDLAVASVELLLYFYPQYRQQMPPGSERAEGEETGSPESEPTPKKGAKATSGK